MAENPLQPLFKEVQERYREAKMLGDEYGKRSSISDMYGLLFTNIRNMEVDLKHWVHLIQKHYLREGNSKEVRFMKRVGSRMYLSLIGQKAVLRDLDSKLNEMYGLE